MTGGWVYILANKPHGVLYVGVTAQLTDRLAAHRLGQGSEFAHKYNCHRLVYAEAHTRIDEAIWREKCIKKWRRDWKIELIEKANPQWRDLTDALHLT